VDADLRFTHLYCGEPGSVHDARVLRKSNLYQMVCEAKDRFFPNGSFLLADSAYPANSWLVTPLRDRGNLTRQQKKFNFLINRGRCVVERTFDILKNRFRRLHKFTEQTDIPCLAKLITSICVLHNVCTRLDDVTDQNVENEEFNVFDNNYIFGQTEVRREEVFSYLLHQNLI